MYGYNTALNQLLASALYTDALSTREEGRLIVFVVVVVVVVAHEHFREDWIQFAWQRSEADHV